MKKPMAADTSQCVFKKSLPVIPTVALGLAPFPSTATRWRLFPCPLHGGDVHLIFFSGGRKTETPMQNGVSGQQKVHDPDGR